MPRKPQEPQTKKGKPTWKPADKLTVHGTPGFRQRWVVKDSANIDKKLAEGWAMASPTAGLRPVHVRPETVQDGEPQTSTTEYRELVLMEMPEELAQARTEYFREKTRQQTAGLKGMADSEDQKNAELNRVQERSGVHGKITVIE